MDEIGKIIGYKTNVGGADTVFPFSTDMDFRITCTVRPIIYTSTDNTYAPPNNAVVTISYINKELSYSVTPNDYWYATHWNKEIGRCYRVYYQTSCTIEFINNN